MVAAAVLGFSGAAASAVVAQPPKRTVESVQTRVKERVLHITTKMKSLQTRVAANKHFTAATKATIQADIVKVLSDTSVWRTKVAEATTMAMIRAATPAREAVMTDMGKLRAHLAAARRTGDPAAE
jgi:hypothetical protein